MSSPTSFLKIYGKLAPEDRWNTFNPSALLCLKDGGCHAVPHSRRPPLTSTSCASSSGHPRSKMPLTEGNHLFCSIGARGEQERQAHRYGLNACPNSATVCSRADEQANYINTIQNKLRTVLEEHFPLVHEAIEEILPASPRTFQRFTRRSRGMVGGIPKKQAF